MASLTTCLKRAGEFLPAADRAAILAAAQQSRSGGMKAGEAGRAAVMAQMDTVRAELAAAEQRLQDAEAGRVQPQPAAAEAVQPDQPSQQAPADSPQPPRDRMEAVAMQFPDLQVIMDGMDAPMPMADFLATVQREADAARADAPDLLDAATCALLNNGA